NDNKYTNNGIVSFSVDIEDINIINIFKYKYVLFVCSTAGDGDIPYSMNKLWKLLCYRYRNKNDNNNSNNKDSKCNVSNSKSNNNNNYQHNNNNIIVNNNDNLFVNLHYAVFGLGDSSFSKYNYASKKLYNILKRLDVNMVLERGEGDDQDRNGYKDGLDPWIEELINNLKKLITEERNIDSSDRDECNSIDNGDRDKDNSDKKEGRDEYNNIDKKNMIKNKY
ncbi:NADPH cytochrome P450 Reductase, partial [Spraguea lophii 42_110]